MTYKFELDLSWFNMIVDGMLLLSAELNTMLLNVQILASGDKVAVAPTFCVPTAL